MKNLIFQKVSSHYHCLVIDGLWFTTVHFNQMFGKRFLNDIFCINNAYVCACYLLCPLPGSALMTWWLPWQRFIETLTEVSKPKYMFHAVLNGVYIIYESMYRFEYIDTYQCFTMKCYPQDVFMSMKMSTVLLICSSIKHCGIRSPNTINHSLLHAVEMYLIVFILNKSLSKSKYV